MTRDTTRRNGYVTIWNSLDHYIRPGQTRAAARSRRYIGRPLEISPKGVGQGAKRTSLHEILCEIRHNARWSNYTRLDSAIHYRTFAYNALKQLPRINAIVPRSVSPAALPLNRAVPAELHFDHFRATRFINYRGYSSLVFGFKYFKIRPSPMRFPPALIRRHRRVYLAI